MKLILSAGVSVNEGWMSQVTYALDLTPACDCVPGTDRAVLPNLGVFASKDLTLISRVNAYMYAHYQVLVSAGLLFLGMAFLFVPITTMSVAHITKVKMGNATSIG